MRFKSRAMVVGAMLCSLLVVSPAAALVQDPPGRGETPCPEDEPTPTPSPSPSESASPTPEASPSPSPSPTPDDCLEPQPDPDPEPKPDDKGDDDKGDGKKDDKKDKDKNKDGKKKNDGNKHGQKNQKKNKKNDKPDFLEVADSYDTSLLLAIAAHLKALGYSRDDVVARVFTPFIIGGKANWIDTWGAPRFGPGLLVRTHEGQDVFCEYGDPILAVEKGEIEYDEGGLGGTIARLHRANGSYWYYAHLSEVNDKKIPSGSRVKPGDVIGFCGNTGNAITTPPHVHFGFYSKSGIARNPMHKLVGWLRSAERHAKLVLARVQGDRVAQIDTFRSARLFGDSFAPDLTIEDSDQASIWAEATEASQDVMGLAKAVLMSAFEEVPDEGAQHAAKGGEKSGFKDSGARSSD